MISVRTQKKENPYVMIDNRPLNDLRLSFGARGLLSYLLSKPDNWKVRMADLEKGPDGKHKIRGYLKELREAGYADLVQIKAEKGKFSGSEWVIYEVPQPRVQKTEPRENGESGKTESPKNGVSEKPKVDKLPPLISTECLESTEELEKTECEKARTRKENPQNAWHVFLSLYQVPENQNLIRAFCQTSKSEQSKILDHLPKYIQITSKRGESSDKPWRKSPLNYLKQKEWETPIEYTDPTILPTAQKQGKVLPPPTGRYAYIQHQ